MPEPAEFGDETPTALYRFYAADGALLYIGITDTLKRRVTEHSLDKKWWPEVARKTVEWHPGREDAAVAELAAIKSEKPKHNIQGRSERPVRPAHEHRPREARVPRPVPDEDDGPWFHPSDPPPNWEPDHWCRIWWDGERSSNCVTPYEFLDNFGCSTLGATDAFGQWYQERRLNRGDGGGMPLVWCQSDVARPEERAGYRDWSYSVHADITCLPDWDSFGPEAEETQAMFLGALTGAGRCRMGRTGRVAVAYGFADDIEARVTGAILKELMWGGTDTAKRSIEAVRTQLASQAA